RYECEYGVPATCPFANTCYRDVFVEYAKAGPEESLVRITAVNRGPERATLHVLPHLWFRHAWFSRPDAPLPSLATPSQNGGPMIVARHPELGTRLLCCDGQGEILFTDNETNRARLYGQANPRPYVKDGIHDYVVHGRSEAVNPEKRGTKAAFDRTMIIEPGQSGTVRLRL